MSNWTTDGIRLETASRRPSIAYDGGGTTNVTRLDQGSPPFLVLWSPGRTVAPWRIILQLLITERESLCSSGCISRTMEMAGLSAGSYTSPASLAPKLSTQNRDTCGTYGLSCTGSSVTLFSSEGPKSIQVGRVQSKWTGGIRCEAGSGTVSTSAPTEWLQKTIDLQGFKRGCHIITQHINRAVPEISQFHVGIAHIFVMHTSASLTINENASPDVPLDMEDSLNRIVPEGHHYRHLDEGLDDMPAHVKASIMGSSLTIPIKSGRLHLGIWQGIWLNEHRDYGGPRSICITIQGQKRPDGRAYR